MEPCNNIQQLPHELRCMIWSTVGQAESFNQLLRTNRLIRSDILSLIPGAGLCCRCPPCKPCTCGKCINVRRLTIIVEPNCSTRSWLKFSVSMLCDQGPSWIVESLDDLLAQPLRYFRPKEIFIDFQAPKKGNYHISFLTLRAKLFDVCSVLDLVQAQKERSLHLHFSDPWANSGSGPNKPFWENRPSASKIKKDDIRRWFRWQRELGLKMRMIIEMRQSFLYFYEMILTPFCMHWAWRNAKVTFDREPKVKSTSFMSWPVVNNKKLVVYHGVKALLLTAWAYTEQLMQEGRIGKSEEEFVPEFENYEVMRDEWSSQERYHSSWKQTLECYLTFVISTSEDFQNIMKVERSQMASLPEAIWWHLDRSPRNAFSEEHPGSSKEAGNAGFEVGTWTWNHDIIRRRYQEWVQLWDGSLDPPDTFDSFYSFVSPYRLGLNLMYESDIESDDESEALSFEDFRAYKLMYTWPITWKSQPNSSWISRQTLDSPYYFYR